MRSDAFLLAMGLLVADSALAGLCKPRTSTLDAATTTSIASTTQPTTTGGETSTDVSSETLVETGTTTTLTPATTTATTSDAQTTTAADTTTTSEVETTSEAETTTSTAEVTTTTSEAETTTTAEVTTTASEAESSTTAADITTTTSEVETTGIADVTTTSEAESTTTTPLPTPTFTLAGGSGSVNGAPLKGTDGEGTLVLFNPNPQFPNIRTRTFILDPKTGRIQDKDSGNVLCAYYGSSSSPSDPARFAFCQNGNTGPNMYYDYMTCQIVSGKLACTAPRASCTDDEEGNTTCLTEPGNNVNNQLYWRNTPNNGDYPYISSGSPGGYAPLDMIVQED